MPGWSALFSTRARGEGPSAAALFDPSIYLAHQGKTPDDLACGHDQPFSLFEGRDHAAGQSISALPVVDADGRLLGIVSESDLIRVQGTGGSEPHYGLVGEATTGDVISVDEETDLPEVARRLLDSKVRRGPSSMMEGSSGSSAAETLIK